MLPRGVQLCVHDVISICLDHSVTVCRTYEFTNLTSDQIPLTWHGRDAMPSAQFSATIGAPGVLLGQASGAVSALEWDLPATILDPETTIAVRLNVTCTGMVQLAPLRAAFSYHSPWICHYSAEVHSPLGGLLVPDQCAISANASAGGLGLILGHDGVLRTDHPVRVSAHAGGCSLTIQKPTAHVPTIPLLEYYPSAVDREQKPLQGHVVLLIPHLLRDSVAYIQSLCAAGLQRELTFIIGIPYSTKTVVGQALWERGFTNIELPVDYPFSAAVERSLSRALDSCRTSNIPLIIVEDGGYAGPLLHTRFAADISLCRGIVEQTRNGIWQYRDQNITPQVPVLNVAESDLKLRRESPLIGDAVVFNVRSLINYYGKNLDRYRTLVVGYGATGSYVAKSLRQAGVNTAVFDLREENRQTAAADKFKTGDSLAELVTDRQLIIGCTGAEPFQFEEILAIPHQAIFVNASSKRREINHEELARLTGRAAAKVIPGVGHVYRLVNGKELILLANGYPVNFVGESVPDQEIAFVMALMQQSAILLARQAASLSPGIMNIPAEVQNEIESRHDGFLRQ